MTKISVNIFGHLLEKIKLKESYVSTEYDHQEERRKIVALTQWGMYEAME